MRNALKWSIVASVLGLGVVGGCGGSSPSKQDESASRPTILKEGLTILSADPATGVSLAFKQGARVVFFETRVGVPKPEGYREAFPNEPANEMDARFVDQKGHTFMIAIGGDRIIDAAWPADIEKGRAIKDTTPKADRVLDYQMAEDAAAAFAAAAPAGLKDHVHHALNLSSSNPNKNERLKQREAHIHATPLPNKAPVTGGDTTTTGYNATSQYNWWEADLYGKCIFLCVGHHTSTLGWNYSNSTGTWDEAVVSCNHGTCAASCSGTSCTTSMSWQTYTNSGWVNNPNFGYCPQPGSYWDGVHCRLPDIPAGTTPFIWSGNPYYSYAAGGTRCPVAGSWDDGANCYVSRPGGTNAFVWSGQLYYYFPTESDVMGSWSKETSTSNSGYTAGLASGCQTNYNWNTPPGHLCNDDSSFEMWNVFDAANYHGASNSRGGNVSFCTQGAGGSWNACSCGGACNNCSGDWSYPGSPGTH
ncbi:MAG: hypothetical protein ACXVEF_17880 [Polyangiales bacterium]